MANEYTSPDREADTLMSALDWWRVERETQGSGGGSGNQLRVIRRLRILLGGEFHQPFAEGPLTVQAALKG